LLDGLGVKNVQVEEDRISFLSAEPEAALRALFGRGLEIQDLEVMAADLEEAFLMLTSRPEAREVSHV